MQLILPLTLLATLALSQGTEIQFKADVKLNDDAPGFHGRRTTLKANQKPINVFAVLESDQIRFRLNNVPVSSFSGSTDPNIMEMKIGGTNVEFWFQRNSREKLTTELSKLSALSTVDFFAEKSF